MISRVAILNKSRVATLMRVSIRHRVPILLLSRVAILKRVEILLTKNRVAILISFAVWMEAMKDLGVADIKCRGLVF
jgi:hypothetical protein